MQNLSPMIAIAGPTASGKSEVALRLAEALHGEIISCDSVQVYRDFEIGTAKPSCLERARAPHHLLDVATWQEDFDAQRYRGLADAARLDILARGRVPILCGGTGLYLRALRYGLAPTPQVSPDLRARLVAEEEKLPGTLFARLRDLDPVSHGLIDGRNGVHVLRALEICIQSGEPASQVRARHGFRIEAVPMRVFHLQRPDAWLKARVVQRTSRMLQEGLLDEVKHLLDSGVSESCRPMRAVGYKEAVDVLRHRAKPHDVQQHIVHSTWQYARRQRTWLRRETQVTALEVHSEQQACDQIVQLHNALDM